MESIISTKSCGKCKEPKALEEFNRNSKSKDGRGRWCKVCQQNHAPRYGGNTLFKVERNKLFDLQGRKCAACGISEERVEIPEYRKFGFDVDHDHATGKCRGILCMRCNMTLGQVDDSIERLEALISYLKLHQV